MSDFGRWLRALGRPAVFAHRGASRAAPENSLAALARAAELGADGVEFDVQRCGSGELVVFHDRSLARCTGAVGCVDEAPLDRLRTLVLDRQADAIGVARTAERIPTLDEWLAAAPRGLFLNLEIKCETWAQAEASLDCVSALRAHGRLHSTVVSSFHPAALATAARAAWEVSRGALVEEGAGWPLRLGAGVATGAAAVHVPHGLATSARVRRWHALGLRVAVWTVDDPQEAQRCLEAGVDVVISNRPELIRPLADRFRRG